MIRFFTDISNTVYFLLFLSISSINIYSQVNDSPVIISEFLAANDDLFFDKDGDSSDWIELFNQSTKTVSLEKWYLTDDPNDPFKWEFPEISLAPGEFLIVFASGKNRNDPNDELHTNFQLDSEGEILALIQRDKKTVASQFSPVYLPQLKNTSYGFIQHTSSTTLVGEKATAKLLIPSNNTLDLSWTGSYNSESFSDTNWKTVTSGIGYDKRNASISTQNIAPLGTASQSSDWEGFPATLVNDTIATNFSHTQDGDLAPWLDIDFDTTQTFGKIELFNRVTCCQERLYNITVEIFDNQNNTTYISEILNPFNEGETPISPGTSIIVNLLLTNPSGVLGSRIRIHKTPVSAIKEYLTLSEVQVFGIEQHNYEINSDIETEMYDINSSVYIRFPFNIDTKDTFNTLSLKMKYDDGFIAYINGTQIDSKNIPNTTIGYDSNASANHLGENYEQTLIPTEVLKQGENILAIHGMNQSADALSFYIKPLLENLQINTIATAAYFNTPTPGRYNNSDGFLNVVQNTEYDFGRGFYNDPFELTVTNTTPGATLIYTTDGSAPTQNNGIKILPLNDTSLTTAYIPIDKTTVIRTIALKELYKSTNIETHTYIFIDDVIASDLMDTSITEDPIYGPKIKKGLTDIPTVSISLTNTLNDDTEESASIEWILASNEAGFQENMGIKQFGGAFTDFDKENFRLYFRSDYGASKLRYPIFEGHENGMSAVRIFDQLELRAGSHDMVSRGFYMSNRFTDDTMLDMGNLNPHGQFVNLYINGVYWGQYHLRERWNADMHAQYLGDEKEDYEAINGNKNVGGWALKETVYDGDGATWEKVKSLYENYTEISEYLDVANYIDYMLLYMFGNSENEYRTVGPVTAGSGFKFYLNDADGFLRNTGNRTSMEQPGQSHADGPASIFSMLFKEASPEYKTLLTDRIHKLFFNDGALTPAKIEARLLNRCEQVENSIIAECARWGYRTPESWEASKNNYLLNIAPFRTNTVINHFINAGFYPSIEAPYLYINDMEQYGGSIETGDQLSLTASYGDIYYTLDGSDPYIPAEVQNETRITLFDQNAPKTIFIPNNTLPTEWNSNLNFDDTNWIHGTGTYGYERSNNGNTIDIDVENRMYNKQLSCLARIKFDLTNSGLNDIKRLFLHLSYDDGAVVYLNGEKIVSVNAPDGTLTYNSSSLSAIESSPLASFNISEYIPLLKTGTNMIAIHGMNTSLKSSDFYISSLLIADSKDITENEISPSAIKYDGSILSLNETTQIKARAVRYGEWSALSDAEYLIEIQTEEPSNELKVKSYPNPFSDGFHISLTPISNVNATLKVYDALGRMIWNKEYSIESGKLSSTYIDTSLWENGLYIYQLELSSGELFTEKLICTKNEY